jgi:hypothetical protein
MSDPNDSTSIALLSSTFLECCAQVRNSDPSILPLPGHSFMIRRLSEKEDIELADALLENTSVTYLQLATENYTKISAEAMAKYVRSSKHLQRIRWNSNQMTDDRDSREEMLCCFLPAFQESRSLKELHINFPLQGEPSYLALESMLTHTQSLRSLTLYYPVGPQEDIAVAATRSGLKKKHHSTGAQNGIFAPRNDCSPLFDRSARPPSTSKALFEWLCG